MTNVAERRNKVKLSATAFRPRPVDTEFAQVGRDGEKEGEAKCSVHWRT